MSTARLDAALHAAIAEGLLPAGATPPAQDERPWPVVLLTAFGAWLAAIPLFAVFALMLVDTVRRGVGLYIVGLLVLGGAIYALRRPRLPLFVEQLLIPMLIVGEGLLAWALIRDLSAEPAFAALAVVAIVSAFAIPRPWLRVVLGAAAATLLALIWMPWHRGRASDGLLLFWLAWHLNLLLWVAAGAAQRTLLADGMLARAAAAIESLRAGWLLATLVGLAWWSGMTFLVGASLGGVGRDILEGFSGHGTSAGAMTSMRAASLLLAVGAAGWAASRWPALRTPASAGVALVLVALSWFMPALGAVLVALSACVVAKRWRLAATAGLAAAWIVGGFYYQLAWPLTTKAGVLVLAGAVLGALAWLAFRGHAQASAPQAASDDALVLRWGQGGMYSVPVDRLGIAATALLVLLAANFAIWQKEQLIAHGQPIFVDLAPRDPRSLMQGDYMSLNFRLPPEVLARADGLLDNKRPVVVARRDERGIATLLRLHEGEPLAAGELRIELTPKGGDWVFVTDAWSFSEGEAERWAAAKYGEFRVDGNGHALLVGLRGANLEKL